MKPEEVKKNIGRKVLYNDSEYTLTACILRQNNYYQAELSEGRSVLIVELEKVRVINSK
jgi:hypothetical protein